MCMRLQRFCTRSVLRSGAACWHLYTAAAASFNSFGMSSSTAVLFGSGTLPMVNVELPWKAFLPVYEGM